MTENTSKKEVGSIAVSITHNHLCFLQFTLPGLYDNLPPFYVALGISFFFFWYFLTLSLATAPVMHAATSTHRCFYSVLFFYYPFFTVPMHIHETQRQTLRPGLHHLHFHKCGYRRVVLCDRSTTHDFYTHPFLCSHFFYLRHCAAVIFVLLRHSTTFVTTFVTTTLPTQHRNIKGIFRKYFIEIMQDCKNIYKAVRKVFKILQEPCNVRSKHYK